MSPGVGGPPLPAAVTHFLPPVLVKPLSGAGVGLGVSSSPFPGGIQGLGGHPWGPGLGFQLSRETWVGTQYRK